MSMFNPFVFAAASLSLLISFPSQAWEISDVTAHYALDGNAQDSSGNGHHGTVYGATATTDRFGTVSGAMSFNGTSDKIVIPDDNAFSSHASGEISVSAWINVHDIATDNHHQTRQPVAAKGFYGDWEWALYVYDDRSAGFSTWQSGGSGHNEWRTTSGLVGEDWVHLAATFTDNVSGTVYVNGNSEATSTSFSGNAHNGVHDLHIGAREDGQYLNADIDDLWVFNKALSAEDVNRLYTGGGAADVPVPAPWALFACGALFLLLRNKRGLTGVDLRNALIES